MLTEAFPANNCELCNESCLNSCGNCGKVSYCSKIHQKLDWKRHRPSCFPGIVTSNPVVGRHLVATRLIKAGTVILKESPIISGPNGRTGLYPLCLACYRQLPTEEFCRDCHWHLHKRCQKDPAHVNHECQVFAKNSMAPFSRREAHMYEKVLILRALLQKMTNPSNWLKIRELQSHSTARLQTRKGELLSKAAIEFIHRVCQLKDFSDEEIDYVLGVLSTNAFVTEDNLTNSSGLRSGSYLFFNGSFPAHDCIPNAKWSISSSSKYTLIALREIAKGESITQLYTESVVGTLERRWHLRESKYFSCTCYRCSDPTENGSYFSAIKCHSCLPGYLLPLDPLDENSNWTCYNPVTPGNNCSESQTVQAIETLLSKIKSDREEIGDENSVEAIEKLEILRTKWLTQIHANHFLIHEIEQDILQRSSYLVSSSDASNNRSNARLTKKERLRLANRMTELSRKSLKLLDKITPGLTTHRGRQMYFLQQGLGTRIQDKISRFPKKQVSNELSIEIEELRRTRETGCDILSTEPEGREEFQLGKKMGDNSSLTMREIDSIYPEKKTWKKEAKDTEMARDLK